MKLLNLLSFFLITLLLGCQPTTTPQVNKETAVEEDKGMVPPDQRFGELFIKVQMSQVFPDGKTFVDCTPKYATDVIMEKYEEAKIDSSFDLKAFVLDNFELPRQYASGFTSDPDRSVKEHINALWPILTREPDSVADERGTLIPLPHPYIVPGGRFGEIYYWDSYFTMLGLQTAGKEEMIENMVRNFSYLIDTIGFIPNGNRTYFLSRSQPPFYAAMINLLADMKGDSIYQAYLPQLEKEYAFWMDGAGDLTEKKRTHRRVVRMEDGSILNRYWDDRNTPRAESYREDVETAKEASGRSAEEVYRHLRAAAESGWDFSSRWLSDQQNLHTIHTTDIIPVDLNALLYNLEKTIAQAYQLTEQTDKSEEFNTKAAQRKEALSKYCWDVESSFFRDYDFNAGAITPVISPAGMFPLFFEMATPEQGQQAAEVWEEKLLKAGGVISTNNPTGQQWDAPNGWAPLQWISVRGLRNYGFQDIAQASAARWIDLNTKVYRNTGKMVEKYNVVDMTLEAGGGEYPVQDGFGWTNGVLLKLMSEKWNVKN